jgi:2-polyprenyl-6-methoxyphenol hydroxylase-like FAD-dependent oxidoreductase
MADLAERTRFPFRLHLEQARVTPAMLRLFEGLPGAHALFGTEFAGVGQDGDGVVVRARRAGGEVELRARFLVGCDGAHSAVRQALGIGFEGEAYPHKILRVMTTDDLDAVLPGIAPVTYLFNAPRSISFLRMPDCWRIILRVPDSVDDATAMRDDWLGERLVEVLPSWTRLPSIAGRDVYGVSRRVASRYAEGAALLAGDSAHVTNTRGGMNMNCGMHDAFALAGAMATALRGGDPACVARASGERRRVAEEMLIPRTDRAVAGGDAWLEKIRATAASPADASAYLATAAMLDMLDRPGAAS